MSDPFRPIMTLPAAADLTAGINAPPAARTPVAQYLDV